MAIYDTGTVTFSGTTVNGSGVNWQTANNPVRPGNTLLVMPANEAFTVVRINSATQLVVNRAPTKAISNSAYCLLLTDALSNDALAQRVSEMTRYYEQQVNAWGQLITASDDVSIVGPDGNTVRVPSLKKLYDGLNGKSDKTEVAQKANKSDLNAVANTVSGALFKSNNLLDVPNKDTARKNLGLGSTNAVFFSGIACRQGVSGGFGSNKYNLFWNTQSQLEAWVDKTRVGGVTLFAINSDKALKSGIRYVSDNAAAYAQVAQWKVAKFKYKARGIIPESAELLGFVANDLVKTSPECVQGKGLPEDYDIEADPNNPDAYYLNQVAMIAKLTQALQYAISKIERLESQVTQGHLTTTREVG